MKPFKVIFHLYAENEKEVQELQDALYDFVTDNYSRKVFVTAMKLTTAIRRFGNNPLIRQFLES